MRTRRMLRMFALASMVFAGGAFAFARHAQGDPAPSCKGTPLTCPGTCVITCSGGVCAETCLLYAG